VTLSNVAAGVAPTDAVNVQQMQEAVVTGNPYIGGYGSGVSAQATGRGSVALGLGSVADMENTISVGDASNDLTRRITNVAPGLDGTDAVNLNQMDSAVADVKTSTQNAINEVSSNTQTAIQNINSRIDAVNLADGDDPYVQVDGFNDGSDNAYTTPTLGGVAIGSAATSVGASSVALGADSYASESEALAIGSGATASNTGAMAFGNSVALGEESMSLGDGTSALGNYATALGFRAQALGNNALSFGNAATAAATDSMAFGTYAKTDVDATNSIALGRQASVTSVAQGSVALGSYSVADRQDAISIGSTDQQRQVIYVARGTADTDAVNVSQLKDAVSVFGGDASVDGTGNVVKPAYSVDGQTYNNVGDALTALDQSGGGTDPNAVAYDSSMHDSVTLGGVGSTTPVKLTGVANGALTASSLDAVNGSQLYGVASSTSIALGGGSTVNADGSISAPTYVIGGGTFNNVGDSLTNLDGRVTQNTTDISNLMGRTVDAVAYDSSAHDSVTLGGSGATSAVRLGNVAAGAVNASSTDAVNGSQLYGTAQSVADTLGGGATVGADGTIANATFNVNGAQYSTVEQAIQAAATSGATDPLAVRYDLNPDGSPNYGSVTLGGQGATTAVVVSNVADGVNRNDAVNYGQLSDLADQVTNIDARVTNIENNGGGGADANPYIAGTDIDPSATTTTPADAGTGTGNIAAGSGASVAGGASNATVIGSKANAMADNSVAIGSGASSKGAGSVAVGQGAVASGANSVALGTGSEATEDNTVSVGTMSQTRRIVNVADGVNASDVATKGQLDRAMGNLQGQVNGVARSAYSGVAAATALTMIPSVDPGKTISFGIGAATYKGYQAVALGGEARITQNLKVKAGVGLSSDGNTVGMGAAYQW
ncbi:MAG TPA: YadA-like family protein, partial [Paraburkholderia sp.]|nr:YadA-like family protein [Paraburkholderia sp.]